MDENLRAHAQKPIERMLEIAIDMGYNGTFNLML